MVLNYICWRGQGIARAFTRMMKKNIASKNIDIATKC